jgi:hypothetical protein
MQEDEFRRGDIVAEIGKPGKYLVWQSFIGWYECIVLDCGIRGMRVSLEKHSAKDRFVKVGKMKQSQRDRFMKELIHDEQQC